MSPGPGAYHSKLCKQVQAEWEASGPEAAAAKFSHASEIASQNVGGGAAAAPAASASSSSLVSTAQPAVPEERCRHSRASVVDGGADSKREIDREAGETPDRQRARIASPMAEQAVAVQDTSVQEDMEMEALATRSAAEMGVSPHTDEKRVRLSAALEILQVRKDMDESDERESTL